MTIQELLELINYRISESDKFVDDDYSGNLWFYSYAVGGSFELFTIFDLDTREICEIRLFDFENSTTYDLINPKFDSMYRTIDDDTVQRNDLSDNVGEFITIVKRLLGL